MFARVILKFFQSLRLHSNTDVSEDGNIYNLKPGQVAASATETNACETAQLNLGVDTMMAMFLLLTMLRQTWREMKQ